MLAIAWRFASLLLLSLRALSRFFQRDEADANLIWGGCLFLLLAPRWRWPAYFGKLALAAMVVGSALVGGVRAIDLLYNALNLVEVSQRLFVA